MGQRPVDFPKTFCGLLEGSKAEAPMLQGQHHQGGFGALVFSDVQLIISRRWPGPNNECNDDWGWTVVRKRDRRGRLRPVWEYFVDDDNTVMSYVSKSPPLKLLPRKRGRTVDLHAEAMEHGTLVRLYDYYPNTIPYREVRLSLEERIPGPALPSRLFECRKDTSTYRSGSFSDEKMVGTVNKLRSQQKTIDSKISWRDSRDLPGYPGIEVETYVFKDEADLSYLFSRSNKKGGIHDSIGSVWYIVNGQTHYTVRRDWIRRRDVNLGSLTNHLLIVVDCSGYEKYYELFKSNRESIDRTRFKPIEEALKSLLGGMDQLRELANSRTLPSKAKRTNDQYQTYALELIKRLGKLQKQGITTSHLDKDLDVDSSDSDSPSTGSTLEEPTFWNLNEEKGDTSPPTRSTHGRKKDYLRLRV